MEEGKIFKFHNDLDTDQIIASQYLLLPNLDEMKAYADGFHVQGGYGTDFRPVFDYVETLRRSGELRNLKGLMYFTDGFGEYPKKPTDYETVFVFYGDEEREEKKVPDWAVKLYLEATPA